MDFQRPPRSGSVWGRKKHERRRDRGGYIGSRRTTVCSPAPSGSEARRQSFSRTVRPPTKVTRRLERLVYYLSLAYQSLWLYAVGGCALVKHDTLTKIRTGREHRQWKRTLDASSRRRCNMCRLRRTRSAQNGGRSFWSCQNSWRMGVKPFGVPHLWEIALRISGGRLSMCWGL
jgi:hypothetical protein